MEKLSRRSSRTPVLVLTAVAVLGCTRSEPAGLSTIELVHRISGRQERETVSYGAHAMRCDLPGESYVLRYEDRTVFLINHEERTWSQTTLAAFVARRKEENAQPDIPDLGGLDGEIRYQATGQNGSFGGIEGALSRIEGKGFQVELWLSGAITIPGPREPTFELRQALGGPLALPAVVFEYLDGFPIRSTVRAEGGFFGEIKVTRALLEIDRTPPAADRFEIPAGYRRTRDAL
jgi:hypothetical protein